MGSGRHGYIKALGLYVLCNIDCYKPTVSRSKKAGEHRYMKGSRIHFDKEKVRQWWKEYFEELCEVSERSNQHTLCVESQWKV